MAWFSSYLSERAITVRVGHTLSSPQSITAGVPQGSHLGPILFLVFINDLPASVGIPTELFADDALIHQRCSLVNLPENEQIQSAITAAEEWATSGMANLVTQRQKSCVSLANLNHICRRSDHSLLMEKLCQSSRPTVTLALHLRTP